MSQIIFLGATVINMNVNLGWGDSESTLVLELVEDPALQQKFTRPLIGTPVMMQLEKWYFGGIIQSWNEVLDPSSNTTFQVTIVDPRDLLSGVQVILDGYLGNITIPNIFNVQGYLNSNNIYKNSSGYTVPQIINSIMSMSNSFSIYGIGIKYLNQDYQLDLSEIPMPPNYYRIGTNMSLLDLIRAVCNDCNHNYFFTLEHTYLGWVIKLKTVNKNTPQIPNAIQRYLNSTLGNSKQIGYELSSEFTSKLLMGGRISKMYFQEKTNYTDPAFNTIWPYWGLDRFNNLITGTGVGNKHTITIDLSHAGIPQLGGFYTTDVSELRAALDSQDSWESFLITKDTNIYNINKAGRLKDTFRLPKRNLPKLVRFLHLKDYELYLDEVIEFDSVRKSDIMSTETQEYFDYSANNTYKEFNIEYNHSNEKNIHFGKATALGLANNLYQYAMAMLFADSSIDPEIIPNSLLLKGFKNTKVVFDSINLNDANTMAEYEAVVKEKLYTYILGIAEEYYGKQFTIKLPFSVVSDLETEDIYTPFQIGSDGYLTPSEFETAKILKYLPISENSDFHVHPKMLTDNGKIYAYVAFNSVERFDYSEFSSDDLLISNNKVYIKCDIDPKIVYENEDFKFGPRAIIRLPGSVRMKEEENVYGYHIIAAALYSDINTNSEIIDKFLKQVGVDNLNFYNAKPVVMPDLAAIPLISEERYGPWYVAGIPGKTEYEINEDLVPWGFYNVNDLNAAAEDILSNSISNFLISENGSIVLPGYPSIILGSPLIEGGPIITGISINIGTSFTTSYQMNTYQIHPYKLSKNRNEYISKLRDKQIKYDRNVQQLERNKSNAVASNVKILKALADSKRSMQYEGTSNEILAGEVVNGQFNVVVQNQSKALMQIPAQSNNTQKSVAGLNSVFAPYSNKSGELPKLDNSYMSGKLNPLKKEDRVQIAYNDKSNNATSETFNWEEANGIGFKIPMVLSGYGIDIHGNPVPNAENDPEFDDEEGKKDAKKEFHTQYHNPKNWKAGILDVRWNEYNKTWSTGSTDIIVQIIDSPPSEPEYYFLEEGNKPDRYLPVSGKNSFNPHLSHSGGLIYYCRQWTPALENNMVGNRAILAPTDNYLLCSSYKFNFFEPSGLWVAKNIGGVYMIDSHTSFMDYNLGQY